MQIPIGARIDRKTGRIEPLFRKGTEDDFEKSMQPIIRAASILNEPEPGSEAVSAT